MLLQNITQNRKKLKRIKSIITQNIMRFNQKQKLIRTSSLSLDKWNSTKAKSTPEDTLEGK